LHIRRKTADSGINMNAEIALDPEEIFPSERRQIIVGVLQREGKVVAAELSSRLKVSIDTIRRDLNQLAQEGMIQRVHGGGLPASPALKPVVQRQLKARDEKQALAEKAAQLIHNGIVVFMDSGSTAVEVARAVDPQMEFTLITHSPRAALTLAEKGSRAEIILLGGRLDAHELVTMSPSTTTEIRKFRADLFFMGICSIHPGLGITCRTLEDLEMKRAMSEASAEVAGLATSEKLGTAAPMVLGPVSMIHYLVTDAVAEIAQEYGRFGVTIL
jgi:DeoR/GlpR family transcriptional regulator of sugar metabolism